MAPLKDDWTESKMYVMNKLNENSKDIVILQDTQNVMAREFAGQVGSLKADIREAQIRASMRAAIIGAVVSIAPVMTMIAWMFFKHSTP